MSGFFLETQNRDFEDFIPDSALTFAPHSAEWGVYGGPLKCKIDVFGPERALWDLLEWLRFSIVVRTNRAERFWWGYVHTVTVRSEGGSVRMSLDEMTNRAKLSYAYMPTGSQQAGDQRETEWAEDADSVAAYGTKELITSMDGATTAIAEARRDAILAARRYPQGEFQAEFAPVSPTSRDVGASVDASMASHLVSAELELRGWWETLGWQYATQPPVVGIDNGVWDVYGSQQFARSSYGKHLQQFTVPAGGGTLREITVSVSREGTRADNLVVEIFALDGNGNPTGSALGSASTPGANLAETGQPGGYNLVTFVLDEGVDLAGETMYGLVVRMSGGFDGSNFYKINLDPSKSYTGGIHKVWYMFGTPAWRTNPSVGKVDARVPFMLWMDEEVGAGRQIAGMVGQSAEFIAGTYFINASDREMSTFLDGSKTLIDELLPVLQGAGANNRRMLAWVDWERVLRVYEEPPATEIGYYLNRRGQILDGYRQVIGLGDLYRVPGTYAQLVDVIPESVDMTRMINPNLQFIESVKWTANGGVKPSFRGQMSLEDIVNGKVSRY